jgi:hypothetical protein
MKHIKWSCSKNGLADVRMNSIWHAVGQIEPRRRLVSGGARSPVKWIEWKPQMRLQRKVVIAFERKV